MKEKVLNTILVVLAIIVTIQLLYASYPGPDEETRTVGGLGWSLSAMARGEYRNDPYHYQYARHKATLSIWGLIWREGPLHMYCYTECYEKHFTTNDFSIIEGFVCKTSYVKTKAQQTLKDFFDHVWTARVEADVVASP